MSETADAEERLEAVARALDAWEATAHDATDHTDPSVVAQGLAISVLAEDLRRYINADGADPDLETALDGVSDAVEWASANGHGHVAADLAELYQRIGKIADWDGGEADE